MNKFLTYLNSVGIIVIIYLLYTYKPKEYIKEKTLHTKEIKYVGDTTINYNQYKSYINRYSIDTTIVNNYFIIDSSNNNVDTIGIKAHQYVSLVKDDTLKGKITALTDGNIFDLKLDYSLNKSILKTSKQPFSLSVGLDIGRNFIQPNFLVGKRFKAGLGYNLNNNEVYIKTNYTIKLKRNGK